MVRNRSGVSGFLLLLLFSSGNVRLFGVRSCT
jgi:hypothetical protein